MKIDWKKLLSLVWKALKPTLLAALGGTVVASASGCCSDQVPTSKAQSQFTISVGVPAVIVYRSDSQVSDNSGDDQNSSLQENPVETTFPSTK